MSTALSGINAARIRFEKSANDALNAVTPASAVEPAESPITPVPAIAGIGTQLTAYEASDQALIESGVDMMTASFAYKANIQILKMWNETTESVISDLSV